MAVATNSAPEILPAADDARKPPLSNVGILLMNFGFFGIQFSFGLQQSAISPIFTFIGASPAELPLLNLAGPMTGLLIQPIIGALSDRTWTRFGRRKPYFVIGAVGCSVVLFLFPFASAVWMAVLGLWLLDASNNTAMEPYRAFISDRLPKSQLARGFLVQAMYIGMGAVLANLSLLLFQQLVSGGTAAGIPYWVFAAFWVGAICSIGSVLVSVLRGAKEIPPTDEELAELRTRPKGVGAFFTEMTSAVREMPAGMHKIGVVFLFQWFGMIIYWQFIAVSMTETVNGFASPDGKPVSEAAAGWVGAVNATYNLVTIFAALALIPLAQRFGAKSIGVIGLLFAGGGLLLAANTHNQWAMLVPMIGLGIGWATMAGIPYTMVASMVPQSRAGVYMGILNMMIVVPMLIETFTFGWIFENLLGSSGRNAIMLAGALLLAAAVAMLWVNPPKQVDQESALMPLGPRRTSVYDRVVVGSDGTPSSLYAVDRAQEVAAEAGTPVLVVSAFSPHATNAAQGRLTTRRDADAAMKKTVQHLTSDRIRRVDQLVTEGDTAQALLAAADTASKSLIVVGNRGKGAGQGELLGDIPAAVVRGAECDVLIVQSAQNMAATGSHPVIRGRD